MNVRYQKAVEEYGQAMMRELEANAHKGDWRDMRLGDLMVELREHFLELDMALSMVPDKRQIDEKAADVGNLAMMVREVALAAWEPTQEENASLNAAELSNKYVAERIAIHDVADALFKLADLTASRSGNTVEECLKAWLHSESGINVLSSASETRRMLEQFSYPKG
jgi:hypothetical protein